MNLLILLRNARPLFAVHDSWPSELSSPRIDRHDILKVQSPGITGSLPVSTVAAAAENALGPVCSRFLCRGFVDEKSGRTIAGAVLELVRAPVVHRPSDWTVGLIKCEC